ncbi:hypothetical protein Hypma_000568 [Hypsizygus marmoreus]|uniref:Uncharacterized protein n=1 Tax=Hypsizygus marmoreus TaxID=39966 RepID=A0A369J899_HYPMA|nr:hypothetical protein Hypma_000568 [Hypsizygus marmoreus]
MSMCARVEQHAQPNRFYTLASLHPLRVNRETIVWSGLVACSFCLYFRRWFLKDPSADRSDVLHRLNCDAHQRYLNFAMTTRCISILDKHSTNDFPHL